MIYEAVAKLMQYGRTTGLVAEEDEIYVTNQVLEALNLSEYEKPEQIPEEVELEDILKEITDYAVSRGMIEDSVVYRDLFDTKIMGKLVPAPSTVIANFNELYQEGPKCATDYFYKLSQDSDYIRRYRIRKDQKWLTSTEYGELEITINLSKPEKDPKAIAAAKTAKQSGYPKCLLCKENEGYAGRVNHPARQNHRIIPVVIDDKNWGFQYSPYVYYNEHCIVFNGEHVPMKIEEATFAKLLDFVTQFPHYFVGSNADLPIVGGSILSHDHFQGGNHEFAMAKAPVVRECTIPGFEDVHAGIVKWPMSVIRLQSREKERLIKAAAPGIVKSIDVLPQTGTTITVDMGNGYVCIYGQLKEVPVYVGDYVEAGTVLGYLSEPTKYYSVEGCNCLTDDSKSCGNPDILHKSDSGSHPDPRRTHLHKSYPGKANSESPDPAHRPEKKMRPSFHCIPRRYKTIPRPCPPAGSSIPPGGRFLHAYKY